MVDAIEALITTWCAPDPSVVSEKSITQRYAKVRKGWN